MTVLPNTESSAIGRDAEVNEVVKGVIVIFKIIFNGLRWLRGLRGLHWLHCRCRGGLHIACMGLHW